MAAAHSSEILIAGAGVAGLTAALAFAARGFRARVFERAPELHEIGAGLQLSPNATRILDELGVLERLRAAAVEPEAVVLRRAKTGAELARVALRKRAETRWHAPYLSLHRAELQQALLAAVRNSGSITIDTDAQALDLRPEGAGILLEVASASGARESIRGALVVAADGVGSTLRAQFRGAPSRRGRFFAWRRTLPADSALARSLSLGDTVNAYLHPRFHLIAYPMQGGETVNLVAFTGARAGGGDADPSSLRLRLSRSAPPLAALSQDIAAWSAWPIREVDMESDWIRGGRAALIGDAAHAMTPFAAQGAAMAIEDAVTLADAVAAAIGPRDAAQAGGTLQSALGAWEQERKARVRAVRRRGAFNQFVWHAAGPIEFGRDMVLRLRSGESLAGDLDWLYGWKRPPVPR